MTIKEYIKTLTPEQAHQVGQVYGKMNGIPVEYDIVDFRPYKKGESFLSRIGEIIVASNDEQFDDPRLILRKKRETVMVPPFSVTFKDIYSKDQLFIPDPYQYVDFRYPKLGELYLGVNNTGIIHLSNNWCTTDGPRVILRKKW